MKTAVLYYSQTGFTRKYAEWIATAVGGECITLHDAKKRDLSAFDAIVYGGPIHAGTIGKVGWFKSNIHPWAGKTLIAFGTGGNPAENPEVETFLHNTFTEEERRSVFTFYCPGGFSYETMPLTSKLMMRLFKRVIASKKNKTEADIEMLNMISKSYDLSDRKYIEPIVQCLAEARAK